MAELRVKPEYLRGLAARQATAAGQIGSAAKAADDVGTKVWISHGLVCGATNEAVKDVEAARRAAAQAMRDVSTDLAANLRAAAAHYEVTDLKAAGNLHNRLR